MTVLLTSHWGGRLMSEAQSSQSRTCAAKSSRGSSGIWREKRDGMLSRTRILGASATALVLAIASAAAAQAPSIFHPPLAILRSEHADGKLSEAHALKALWYAAAELNVPAEKIPRILLIHGGRDVAVAGAWQWPTKRPTSGAVLVEPTTDGRKVYYLWILGKPSDDILARGLVEILLKELGSETADISGPAKRVVSRLASVVSADELGKGMFSSTQQ